MLDLQIPPRPDSRLPHAGTYVREMAVSVERMYENALDWAHLPYLHGESFSRIELLAQEPLAWRARVWNPPPRQAQCIVIELRLDPECRRWITRTLEGANAGGEIWTHCIPLSDDPAKPRLQVVVDFFVPGLTPDARPAVSQALLALYRRLYDEDERMMLERQAALDRRVVARAEPRVAPRDLGPRSGVLARVPFDIDAGRRRFRVYAQAGELHAHALDCPHLLAPLDRVASEDGVLTCPWHGFRFDLRDGRRLPGGSGNEACRLPVRALREDARGHVILDP